MNINKATVFSKDLENRKIMVVREFEAPVHKVWKAWTEHELLDQWWAPKPWKAKTKSMDFKEGGVWLYSMVGPDGTDACCRVGFQTIDPQKSFTAKDAFCDEDGNPTTALPGMLWKTTFLPIPGGTKVAVELTFSSVEDLEKIIEMGFKEGFAAAHENLDEMFSTVVA